MRPELLVSKESGELSRTKNHRVVEEIERAPVAKMHQVEANGVLCDCQTLDLPETSVCTGKQLTLHRWGRRIESPEFWGEAAGHWPS